MPDPALVVGDYVLYKPEGGQNYYFYDKTGTRLPPGSPDLQKATEVAHQKGITISRSPSEGLYVQVADYEKYRNAAGNNAQQYFMMPEVKAAPVSAAVQEAAVEDYYSKMFG